VTKCRRSRVEIKFRRPNLVTGRGVGRPPELPVTSAIDSAFDSSLGTAVPETKRRLIPRERF
jgi:hypothetical protein